MPNAIKYLKKRGEIERVKERERKIKRKKEKRNQI
jgi:hypothetical protein